MRALPLGLLALVLVVGPPGREAFAHEVRPAYLELTALGAGAWEVLWKVPARGELRLGLYVRLPASCEPGVPLARPTAGAHVERWRARCVSGLLGETVRIDGLAATRTDVLARVHHADGTVQTERLTPRRPAFRVTSAPGSLAVAGTYLGLGVEHILFGVDHLLFVLALVLLVRRGRPLVGAVTAFTAAHSLTLAAAALGWIHVPAAPVEAAIALSIVLVAAELVRGGGRAERSPWAVAFCFGLLHGFGFAGALRDVGLPEHAIPLALLFFNAGVEAGQLLFIASVLAFFAVGSRLLPLEPERTPWAAARWVARPAAYAIGIGGSYWLVERTLAFWVA